MAGIPKVKITFDADFDELRKGVKGAQNEVEGFGSKVADFGKKMAAAFAVAAAAAGAYAIKIGVEGVKAAVADEKAQTQLALALKNATGATNAQIKATEQYILQTSLATGVADDALRPALGRLARSTQDITKAQELLTTALDISTATGKPLEAVANSLGRAFDGNTTSLGKLGIGLSAAELKTMSFTDVQNKLSTLFGGAAAANADTYAGKMARVQVAIDEAKETLGAKLLPILETFINFINQRALPFINAFANGFSLSGNSISNVANTIKVVFTPIVEGLIKAFGYVKNAIGDNLDAFKEFGGYISTYLAPIIGTVLGGALQVVGKIAGGVIDVIGSITKVINSIIGTAIDGINALIRAYNAIPILPNIPTINKPTTNTGNYSSISGVLGSTTSSAAVSIPTIPSPSMSSTGGGGGGVANVAASAVVASTYTSALSQSDAIRRAEMANPSINLTVNQGIVGDPEAAARSVVDVLNRSFFRGTGGANALLFG
jgi:hypothetical protein